MKYFVVDLRDLRIMAITDDPTGFNWSVPHVFLPTLDDDWTKFKVSRHESGEFYLDDISDQLAPVKVTPWWKFWSWFN